MNYLRWAKFFLLLSTLMGLLFIVSWIAVAVELIRGFFSGHQHWLYMIGWYMGAKIFRSVAFAYRRTAREYEDDAIQAGQITDTGQVQQMHG